MVEGKRETLRWFPDINGTQVYEGSRVAIGIAEYGSGALRIGEVVKDGITAVFLNGEWRYFRVKVKVDTVSGYLSIELPYVRTYEDPKRMVKLS